MAFDKLERIEKSGRAGMPAAVSLRGKSGRPLCVVAVTKEFASKAGFGGNDKFDVLLGGGEQKGLLRLKRDKKGILAPKMLKGGIIFNLGHIEKFGSEPEKKEYCRADVIDENTIEVVLPRWADEIED